MSKNPRQRTLHHVQMDHCILHIKFSWCQMSLFMIEVDLIDLILIFPKAQVTSNKMEQKKMQHFLRQFFKFFGVFVTMLVYLVTITLKTSIHKLLLDIQVQPQANIERVQNEIPRNFRTYVLLYIAAYIYIKAFFAAFNLSLCNPL